MSINFIFCFIIWKKSPFSNFNQCFCFGQTIETPISKYFRLLPQHCQRQRLFACKAQDCRQSLPPFTAAGCPPSVVQVQFAPVWKEKGWSKPMQPSAEKQLPVTRTQFGSAHKCSVLLLHKQGQTEPLHSSELAPVCPCSWRRWTENFLHCPIYEWGQTEPAQHQADKQLPALKAPMDGGRLHHRSQQVSWGRKQGAAKKCYGSLTTLIYRFFLL